MGKAAGRNSSLKETQILNMKQNEIMHYFREGLCNLLVATSVLVNFSNLFGIGVIKCVIFLRIILQEEGIDIPDCNLIIRFDRIKT
jgi:endoribonuclease Dicer